MNRVVVVGRLTRDPELKYTPSGHAVANFNVAVNRQFKNKDGEQEADFIQCVTWRKQAENLANYMKKGSQIGVDGRLQTRNFEDKNGRTVFVTEILAESIQFLESKNSTGNTNSSNSKQQPKQTEQPQQPQSFEQAGEQINIGDDDLPF